MLGMELSNFWIRRVCGWFQIVNAFFDPIWDGWARSTNLLGTSWNHRAKPNWCVSCTAGVNSAPASNVMFLDVCPCRQRSALHDVFSWHAYSILQVSTYVFFMSIWNIHIYPHYVPLYINMILYAKCSMFVYWLGFCHHAACITCHVSRSWKKIQSLLQLVPSSLVGWVTLRWWEHLQDNLCFS
jgi:hypothetical protein